MESGTVGVIETPVSRLMIRARIRTRDPRQVFRDWTEPGRLRLWWPPQAQTDVREGGTYVFHWPVQDWTLRGAYKRVLAGQLLEFSWAWDHEPDRVKNVAITLVSDGLRGTILELVHSTYSDDARDAELRQEHLEGWLHFLRRLVELPLPDPTPSR